MRQLPQFAVSKWIGHSLTISGRHYANHVRDELFDRAAAQGKDASDDVNPAGGEAGAGDDAARHTARKAAETPRNGKQTKNSPKSPNAKTPANAGVCDALPIGAATREVEAGGMSGRRKKRGIWGEKAAFTIFRR